MFPNFSAWILDPDRITVRAFLKISTGALFIEGLGENIDI